MHVWIKWKLLYLNPSSIFAEYFQWITKTLNMRIEDECVTGKMCFVVCIFWSRLDTRPSKFIIQFVLWGFDSSVFSTPTPDTRKTLFDLLSSQLTSGFKIVSIHFAICFGFECKMMQNESTRFDVLPPVPLILMCDHAKLKHSNWMSEWIVTHLLNLIIQSKRPSFFGGITKEYSLLHRLNCIIVDICDMR